jgi:hypothetical protein
MKTKVSFELPVEMLKSLEKQAKTHVHGSTVSSVIRKAIMLFLAEYTSACTCNPLSPVPSKKGRGVVANPNGRRRGNNP